MRNREMTPMERVETTLSHKEPDRVPLFLMLSMHGALELGISIEEYFSTAENVVEGQIRLQKKYSNDCYNPFFYAGIEVEAFGAKTIFREDGPPNSGEPVIKNINEIIKLETPRIKDAKALHKVLKAIELLKAETKGDVPIVGVAVSPFSLPIMQLGFEKYLDVLHFHKELFNHLIKVNEAFCVEWANAQLNAGASFITYFDPMSSTSIIPKELYSDTGHKIAKRTISQIQGNTATHFASGNCLPIANLIPETGTAAVGVGTNEEISEITQTLKNKLTVIGNLNGVEMRRWSYKKTTDIVRDIIQKAAPGGGFILSDSHGEIPFQVKEETLFSIVETVKKYGTYPILQKTFRE